MFKSLAAQQRDAAKQGQGLHKHRHDPAAPAGIVRASDDRHTLGLDSHDRPAIQLGGQLRVGHEQAARLLEHQRKPTVARHLHG
jgi:hypothetical protein